MSIYLDHNATTPLSKSVVGKLDDLYKVYYNPSSIYESGNYNMRVIENVREKIAKEINADTEEIIFTSCASESNSLAIDGFLKANNGYNVICSNIEHSSILNNKNIYDKVKCDENGFVNPKDFKKFKNTLISVMMVNNEIGTKQPIKEIVDIAHKNGNIVMTDAVQAFGKVKIDVKYLGVDMLTASGAGGMNEIQYAALLMMIARHTGYKAGVFCHFVQNEQIYDRHEEQAMEIFSRFKKCIKFYVKTKYRIYTC